MQSTESIEWFFNGSLRALPLGPVRASERDTSRLAGLSQLTVLSCEETK
jgi:hypothetical protein